VVVVAVGILELVVEPVPDGYLGYYSQLFEQVEGTVYGGDIHVRIGLLRPTEHLVHSHVITTPGYNGQHQQPLGGETVPLLPKGLYSLFVPSHASRS
jgi:hypothetical protein